jgi:hypothetical protein
MAFKLIYHFLPFCKSARGQQRSEVTVFALEHAAFRGDAIFNPAFGKQFPTIENSGSAFPVVENFYRGCGPIRLGTGMHSRFRQLHFLHIRYKFYTRH